MWIFLFYFQAFWSLCRYFTALVTYYSRLHSAKELNISSIYSLWEAQKPAMAIWIDFQSKATFETSLDIHVINKSLWLFCLIHKFSINNLYGLVLSYEGHALQSSGIFTQEIYIDSLRFALTREKKMPGLKSCQLCGSLLKNGSFA